MLGSEQSSVGVIQLALTPVFLLAAVAALLNVFSTRLGRVWSLTSLKEKLIKNGAKVVSHGRYLVFQMAEVAIPRQMFQEILRLIGELRPQPPPRASMRRPCSCVHHQTTGGVRPNARENDQISLLNRRSNCPR